MKQVIMTQTNKQMNSTQLMQKERELIIIMKLYFIVLVVFYSTCSCTAPRLPFCVFNYNVIVFVLSSERSKKDRIFYREWDKVCHYGEA